MDWLPILILSIEGLIFLGIIVLTIILAIRRVKIKKKETFEDRDN